MFFKRPDTKTFLMGSKNIPMMENGKKTHRVNITRKRFVKEKYLNDSLTIFVCYINIEDFPQSTCIQPKTLIAKS